MSPLWTAGLLCAALLAAFGLWGWLARKPRVRASDAGHWSDEPGDPTHERIDQALDVVAEAALQWLEDIEQRKVAHTDAAMRRLTGADIYGTCGPHDTPEEVADCAVCSPSGLPRRIEGGDEHG